MSRLFERIRSIWRERRKKDEPHPVERRGKRSRKEVQHRLDDALDDLERTVSIKREDLFKFSANDVQQEVQFSTFRAICRFQSSQGQFNLCRHPNHEAANTGIAKCDEHFCPFVRVQREPA